MHRVHARGKVVCHDDNVAGKRSQPRHCMLVAYLQCMPLALRVYNGRGDVVSSGMPNRNRNVRCDARRELERSMRAQDGDV